MTTKWFRTSSQGQRHAWSFAPHLVSICACMACGRGATKQAATAEQPRADSGTLEPASAPRARPPALALQLEQRVERLSNAPAQATPREVAAALRSLALNVASLSGQLAVAPIRSAADELAGLQPDAQGGSSASLRALRAAGGVLLARVPSDGEGVWREARLEFEASLRAIDGTKSFREGLEGVLSTLRAATNLLYLAYKVPPPFEVADTDASSRRLPPSFCAGVEIAQASVTALARASSYQSRARAADALNAIADALAVHDQRATQPEDIQAIRFEASLLRREGTFDGARAVKFGLSRIVELMAATLESDHARSWIDAARKAVDAIDPGFVTFERASVQDAFRQVVDAMVIAECYRPTRS